MNVLAHWPSLVPLLFALPYLWPLIRATSRTGGRALRWIAARPPVLGAAGTDGHDRRHPLTAAANATAKERA